MWLLLTLTMNFESIHPSPSILGVVQFDQGCNLKAAEQEEQASQDDVAHGLGRRIVEAISVDDHLATRAARDIVVQVPGQVRDAVVEWTAIEGPSHEIWYCRPSHQETIVDHEHNQERQGCDLRQFTSFGKCGDQAEVGVHDDDQQDQGQVKRGEVTPIQAAKGVGDHDEDGVGDNGDDPIGNTHDSDPRSDAVETLSHFLLHDGPGLDQAGHDLHTSHGDHLHHQKEELHVHELGAARDVVEGDAQNAGLQDRHHQPHLEALDIALKELHLHPKEDLHLPPGTRGVH
mmetsp:Transcript_4333/g.10268  ORF Transcript_4333/g.10268 Transcript_4333/m.10268 type:complete len:288 (-) Transcript_4333:1441-2304(-)